MAGNKKLFKKLLKMAIKDYFNTKHASRKIEEDDLWRIKQNLKDETYKKSLVLSPL